MKIVVKPLFSRVNAGVGHCPLNCQQECRVLQKAASFKPQPGCTCPLSSHQAQTAAAVLQNQADIIFNTSVTGDGKSLAATLPVLLDPEFRMVGLYPTNELVEDQVRGQESYHQKFGLDTRGRLDLLYGQELGRRVETGKSNRFKELSYSIQHRPVLLTNPDLFHLMMHFRYFDAGVAQASLPLLMADFPDYWVFDEFHIFGPHQEAAVLNSLCFIREATQEQKRFLFTSATPKETFVKQLTDAGFSVQIIQGHYSNEAKPGYRPILQPTELTFTTLRQQTVLDWLDSQIAAIDDWLKAERWGRGLIVMNSVAQVGRAVRLLQNRLPHVTVREISGRIKGNARQETQEKLKHLEAPVLVVGTSAVDVGVDFNIHLLIFESSDSATVIQRLGRLGRHPGFNHYQAVCLLPGHMPWIESGLEAALSEQSAGQSVNREQLNDAIRAAFAAPQAFEAYRHQWGALQSQGMIAKIKEPKETRQVVGEVCDRILKTLTPVYSAQQLETAQKRWYGMGSKPVGKAIQAELLRFRGGTTLQAAVWDDTRFYTYDLLRLLPYTEIKPIEPEAFLSAAAIAGYGADFFTYAQAYFKVERWLEQRLPIELRCARDNLTCCDLIQLKGLRIEGHPNVDVVRSLSQQSILSFLLPLDKRQSQWDVAKELRLSPLFGLYLLTDGSEQRYACAFNQDALLLKALSYRLKEFCQRADAMIF